MTTLVDGTPDPCDDPANAGTSYCLTRLTYEDGPETPAEWNQRTAKALDVTITQGNTPTSVASSVKPWLPWLAVGALVALVVGRRR